jgi:hypothetical protein
MALQIQHTSVLICNHNGVVGKEWFATRPSLDRSVTLKCQLSVSVHLPLNTHRLTVRKCYHSASCGHNENRWQLRDSRLKGLSRKSKQIDYKLIQKIISFPRFPSLSSLLLLTRRAGVAQLTSRLGYRLTDEWWLDSWQGKGISSPQLTTASGYHLLSNPMGCRDISATVKKRVMVAIRGDLIRSTTESMIAKIWQCD